MSSRKQSPFEGGSSVLKSPLRLKRTLALSFISSIPNFFPSADFASRYLSNSDSYMRYEVTNQQVVRYEVTHTLVYEVQSQGLD